MTISTQLSSVLIQGNGAQTLFAYNFLIPNQANSVTPAVRVSLVDVATGIMTALLSSEFSITGVDSPSGGTVTYPLAGTALTSATALYIERALDYTQPFPVANQSFYPNTVEQIADWQEMQQQQLATKLSRAVTVYPGDAGFNFPKKSSLLGKLLGVDLAGNIVGIAGSIVVLTGIISGDSAALAQVRQADNTVLVNVNSLNAYAGTGTATTGAPRIYIGTLTPSGDDSAINVGRNINGNALFSHAFRDESWFTTTGVGAYASFDSRYILKGSGVLNHARGFQGAMTINAPGATLPELAPFATAPIVMAGTVSYIQHYKVQNVALIGGTVNNQIGLWVNPLSGAGVNYGIYVEANNSALLGNLQINGILNGVTDIAASGNVASSYVTVTNSINAGGGIASFLTGGGVAVAGNGTGSGYAVVRAYNNGAGANRGLALNPTGGQVSVNAAAPLSGHAFEVSGMGYFSSGLAIGNSAAATTVGTVVAKFRVYDAGGTSIGWVPVVNSGT